MTCKSLDEMTDLITISIAAKYLGWSYNRVRRAIDSGRLKANGGKGSFMMIPKADFRRFCNGEESEPVLVPVPKRRVRF
jgi:excisionase family DNA binding protein